MNMKFYFNEDKTPIEYIDNTESKNNDIEIKSNIIIQFLEEIIKGDVIQLPELDKVDQTYFTSEYGMGNCFQASVATLFSIPLDSVPDLRPFEGVYQKEIFKRWLTKLGFGFIQVGGHDIQRGYYLVTGPCDRAGTDMISHVVVMRDGEYYFDPHPSRQGISYIYSTYILYPLNIAAMRVSGSNKSFIKKAAVAARKTMQEMDLRNTFIKNLSSPRIFTKERASSWEE